MKVVVIFFMCVLGACLFSEGLGRCQRIDITDSNETVPAGTKVDIHCSQHTCNEDGSWFGKACPLSHCVKQIGYVPYNYSKPYPECCPYPICG